MRWSPFLPVDSGVAPSPHFCHASIDLHGKVYEVVEVERAICDSCDLKDKCNQSSAFEYCIETLGAREIFRYSQSLTDKLNK